MRSPIEPQESLMLTLVQTAMHWEDTDANLASLEERLATLEEAVDVIVLPEMFATGFSLAPAKIAEPVNLTITRWMHRMAAWTDALLIGSFACREGNKYFNRLVAMQPDGHYQRYDKRHLFSPGGEHLAYTSGNERTVVAWRGWTICPLICYDLRFPVWSRNRANAPYDLLIFVANWPTSRAYAWDTLLKARAIENVSYVAGVNRCGEDGNGIAHSGASVVTDFLGQPLLTLGDQPAIASTPISKQALLDYRMKFPVLDDADAFDIV